MFNTPQRIITGFLEDQRQLIGNYWSKHTLEEGVNKGLDEATSLVKKAVKDSHYSVQALAGAGMGVAKLAANIPVGLLSWGKQVVQESPKGLGATLYKLGEVPVKGLLEGTKYVAAQGLRGVDASRKMYRGEIAQVDSWEIAHEVTSTLAILGMTFMGIKSVLGGAGKLRGPLPSAPQPALAMAGGFSISAGALELAKMGKGVGKDVGAGLVMMASAAQTADANGHESPMVSIPGGKSVRGSKRPGVSFKGEAPVHVVEVAPFRIQRTPAINEGWIFQYWTTFRDVPYAVLGREAGTGIWRVVQRGKTKKELHSWVRDQKRENRSVVDNGEFIIERDSLQVKRVIPEKVLPSSKGFDGQNQPVVNTNWYEAVAAADCMGRVIEGRPWHLPTEAQWEVAARGPIVNVAKQMGLESISLAQFADFVEGPQVNGAHVQGRYGRFENFVKLVDPDSLTFGTEVLTDPHHPTVKGWLEQGQLGAFRVFPTESGVFESSIWSSVYEGRTATRPVNQGIANGLLDKAGNVWEWVNDWYGPYEGMPLQNPTGPINGQSRVLRGGSWYLDDPRFFRAALRNRDLPDNSLGLVGLRGASPAPRAP